MLVQHNCNFFWTKSSLWPIQHVLFDNSFWPSDAMWWHRSGSALAQVMACTKPLSEPILPYYQLDPKEQTLVNFLSKLKHFHWRICVWKCHLPKWQPSCLSLNELRWSGIEPTRWGFWWQMAGISVSDFCLMRCDKVHLLDLWVRRHTLLLILANIKEGVYCTSAGELRTQLLIDYGFNTLRLRQIVAILQMTISNAFSWLKMYEFWLRFQWSLFLKFELIIFHHWFR